LGPYDRLAHKYRDDATDIQLQWKALPGDGKWDITTMLGWHNQVNQSLPVDGSGLASGTGLSALPAIQYRQNNPQFHSVTDFIDLPPGADSTACDPWVDPNDPNNTTQVCPANVWYTGGPGFIRDRRLNRLQFRSMAGRTFEAAGHHNVKFGVDFEYMQYDSERGYTGTTYYRESTSGAYFSDYRRYGYLTSPDVPVVLDSLKWRVFSTTIGGFVQDSWAIADKVTLNAGLRYDAQHLFGGDGLLSMALPNQVSPRVGLIWDPTQAGKAKLFVNYARFYQSVPLNLADRAGSGEPDIGRYYSAADCDPQDPNNTCQSNDGLVPIGAGPDSNRYWFAYGAGKTAIDPKLKPQSSDEIVGGGEYEVLPNGKIGLAYTHRWLSRVIEDMSRDEATTYFIGNPGYGIAKDFPKAVRNYDAMTIYFQKAYSRNWLLSGSYTMSWLRGNIAGLFRPETGQLDPNINSDFDLISLLDNRTGYLAGDTRHVLKVFSAGEIVVDNKNAVLLGGAFRARSGQPVNALGSHPLYGSGEAFLVERGTYDRTPWTFGIDTNVGYSHRFSKDVVLSVTMDIFNVANFQQVVAVDQTYTYSDVNPIEGGTLQDLENHTDVYGDPIVKNPNFGNPTAYQTPRTFRFGVRLNF
ncbi:MAG: TonB-dependent receptor, partial [Myxococcales bacterium]|nr:TonB-dependent receptor [Myxococcales bacterium]